MATQVAEFVAVGQRPIVKQQIVLPHHPNDKVKKYYLKKHVSKNRAIIINKHTVGDANPFQMLALIK